MNRPPRILVACIGNIFLGDDAFGVHVAQGLMQRKLPAGASVVDFGIRGIDLAYALMDGLDASILVDATPRNGAPGTLYLIESDTADWSPDSSQSMQIEAHSLDPAKVLAFVHSLGGNPGRVFVLGCEPSPIDPQDDIQTDLSPNVRAAIAPAILMVESLITRLQNELLQTEINHDIEPIPTPI